MSRSAEEHRRVARRQTRCRDYALPPEGSAATNSREGGKWIPGGLGGACGIEVVCASVPPNQNCRQLSYRTFLQGADGGQRGASSCRYTRAPHTPREPAAPLPQESEHNTPRRIPNKWVTRFAQNRLRHILTFMLLSAAFLTSSPACAELEFEPTWQTPSNAEVQEQIADWLDSIDANQQQRREVRLIWSRDSDPHDLLDRVIASLSVADRRVAVLVELVGDPASLREQPNVDWLDAVDGMRWASANARLYLARSLMHARLYDEAAFHLERLALDEVVDPAALLFYRMSAYHQIVRPDRARAALVQLLEREESIPRRYAQLARLVESDLASLDDQSLDHISRRMDDIRRRLEIGRTGRRVQDIERSVVESLEKMIEEQQKQQQQQQSQRSGSPQSSRPMDDSRLPAKIESPGRVDAKSIGNQSGWGDLPPKERRQAMEQLAREFPVHYRELIEQYFRDLADQSESQGPR